MKIKRIMALVSCLLLTACAPSFGEPEEIVQETEDESKEQAIIPKYNISDSYYKMILPFKEGEARGLVTERLNTRLDIDEFETGLMRIAQSTFSSDKYLYQEGQYLKEETIRKWLGRKLEGKALEDAQKEAKAAKTSFSNLGLNPPESTAKTDDERNAESPIYLAHMLEHNYLIRKDESTVELGGIVIGLALNSVHYYRQEDGYPREREISRNELQAQGERMAQEALTRIRSTKGMEKVPVVFALYEQEAKSSIVPGNFIASTVVKENTNSIGDWEPIDEDYFFFPSPEATEAYRDDATMFNRFKTDVDDFFPNYTGVIGKAYYKDGEFQELKIEIPMQFYGKAEVIAFTQFATGKVMEYFPDYISLEVNITSTSGQEALILRNPGQETPTVHIYK